VKGDEKTMHIHLRPEVEARLQAQAKAKGVSLERYVQTLLEQTVLSGESETASDAEFEAAMDALSEGLDHLPVLSAEALTRAGIYRDDD
jgi:predicted DNA-binding protein